MKQIFYKLFENLKQLGIKPSIGSRTNVTPIPGSEIDRIINKPVAPKEFDYSKPEVVDSIRGIVKNASDYVGQFTERQAKTFNDNIERILNVIKPKETTADVVDLATKEKITGPGLESLMKEKGVPSISRKTIEAETLIKQFLDDDLISLNAKQIDQLSRGKAEDVFENIFGSKAKELITGKNTNESLNEVYKKLKTTKDVKGRLPDDPSFDPSDIEFKEGGSVSEDVRQLLKEEFIKIINEDPEAYPDTNAGFRRFLKRKGAPVFNYKDGGRTGYSNGTSLYDKEFDKNEDGQITYDEFLNKSSEKNESSSEQENLVNRITGGKIKIGADLATKNPKDPFNKIGFGERNPKDPRLGIEFIEDPADERSSRIGISIGPKGGGITFMKPFSEELIDEENMSSKMTDEELIQNYINFAKNVWGMKVTEDEARKTLGIYKIPDTNVRDLIIPKKKDGGRIVKRRQEKKDGKLGPTDPLSKYESYSEEELAGNIEAKKPTFDTLEDYIMETMPMFVPRDVAPPKSYSPMPVEEYLRRRFQIELADGGLTKTVPPVRGPNSQGVESLFKKR